jgi:hypothetical protein
MLIFSSLFRNRRMVERRIVVKDKLEKIIFGILCVGLMFGIGIVFGIMFMRWVDLG